MEGGGGKREVEGYVLNISCYIERVPGEEGVKGWRGIKKLAFVLKLLGWP